MSSASGPYSLSGDQLEGSEVVRLVYIDEAGISNRKQEPFTVVAGAVVHADTALNGIENQLERILERHIPKHYREGFVFHATEVFNGGGKVFKRYKNDFIGPPEWPRERRFKIADEILTIPTKFSLPIALGWVERATFQQDFELGGAWGDTELTVAEHATSFLNCAAMADQWMQKNASNENCLLVIEDNDQARKTIRRLHNHYRDKKYVSPPGSEHVIFPFRKIKEEPLFQSKKPSNPLIVADFCAYVWKRILMEDERYNRFFEPFRKKIISFEDTWLERRRGRLARSVPRTRQPQASERLQ